MGESLEPLLSRALGLNAPGKAVKERKPMKTFRRTFLFAVLALLASGPAFGAIHTNTITGFSFVPRNMTIKAGDTIVWVNVASHSVTGSSAPEAFCGSTIFGASAVSCSATFNVPGTYNYYCRPHNLEFNMNGSVTVQPVFAATNTWTGADPSGYWSAPANWSPVGVPVNGNDLVFPGGLPPGDMVSTNDLTGSFFRSITFGGASMYTIRGNPMTLTNRADVIINNGTNVMACDLTFSGTPPTPTFGVVSIRGKIGSFGVVSELTVIGNVGGGSLYGNLERLVINGQFTGGTLRLWGGTVTLNGDDPSAGSAEIQNSATLLVQGSRPNLNVTTFWEFESAACPFLSGDGVVGDVFGCGHIILDSTLSVKSLGGPGASQASWRVLDIHLNGTNVGEYGRLISSGDVTLTGGSLSASPGFNPQPGQIFTIVEKTSPGAITNAPFGPEGSLTTLNGMPFRISYVGGDGNDVTLTANTPPRLDIARTNSAQVRLSWPTNYPGFQLLRASAIDGSPSWSNHLMSPVVMGSNYTVTQPAATNQEFFRLKQP